MNAGNAEYTGHRRLRLSTAQVVGQEHQPSTTRQMRPECWLFSHRNTDSLVPALTRLFQHPHQEERRSITVAPPATVFKP